MMARAIPLQYAPQLLAEVNRVLALREDERREDGALVGLSVPDACQQ